MKSIAALIMTVFLIASVRAVASWTGLRYEDAMFGTLAFLLSKFAIVAIVAKEGKEE